MEDRYEPGDTATMTGYFGRGQLGWLDDGPFFAHLRVDPAAVAGANLQNWPNIHATDLLLGEILMTSRGGSCVEAKVTFAIPEDVTPGAYDIVYCNAPCTKGVGDLIGGTIFVDATHEISREIFPADLTAESVVSIVTPSTTAPLPDTAATAAVESLDSRETDPNATPLARVVPLATAGTAVAALDDSGLTPQWLWAAAAFFITALLVVRRRIRRTAVPVGEERILEFVLP